MPGLLAAALEENGYSVATHEGIWLEHQSGYQILPLIVDFQPTDRGGVRTTTTIQVHHPTLVPAGVFEYQHSTGDCMQDSIRRGFDQWVRTDFVTLLDAAAPQGTSCMNLVMTIPATEGKPERTRRAVLGPIAHYQATPPASDPEEEHPFCPCCLLTRSFPAFKELFEADGLIGVRLFALRDDEGDPAADCRVNGEDYPAGTEALRAYATNWPPAGYEFRKQYIVFQTIEKSSEG